MEIIAEIAATAGVSTRRSGPTDLVPLLGAEEVIKAIASRGLVIIGIEGFRFSDQDLVADINAIADFSSLKFNKLAAESTAYEGILFIRRVGKPEMFFEFIVE